MPSAAPSSRVASFIAEPAPARLSGTADMIDDVIGDIDSDTPVISGVRQSQQYQNGVSMPSCVNSPNPSAIRHMPNADRRGCRRSAARCAA